MGREKLYEMSYRHEPKISCEPAWTLPLKQSLMKPKLPTE